MSRVVLDGAVLGLGFFNEQSRTGIYRVAENLIYGLHRSPDIELAITGTQHLPEILGFLEKNYPNAGYPVLNTPKDLRYAHFENSLVSAFAYKSLPQKLIREVFTRLRARLKPGYNPVISALEQYDVYHSPFLPTPAGLEALTKPARVITVHDIIPYLFPQYFGEWNVSITKQILDCIKKGTYPVCISESTKNDLCEATGVSPDRVFVVPLAASAEKFYQVRDNEEIEYVLKKYGISVHKRYLLSLSTLEPRKNIERTIRSFIKLVEQEKIEDLNLVLVGTKGWDFEAIFDEIKANPSLRDKIIITGYVEDKDLAAIYSAALGFVYPSLYEGFGLPPLEAMQCGTPVISSTKSSLPEVVEDAGILVDPTDEEAIAGAMLQLYTDKNLHLALSKKSLAQAQKFSWDKFTEQHLQIYRQIC
ncbi:glycosyltransferase family 1 protein [Emticicia sp. 21SJ11W-3]|uniref:glycosyltransferase family 4 protein n=1 Tax=Emticicia sp. 21SJ11W-3 TaxID=2916755 RepID=UPI00209FE93C|nr:glycosyltransferase family 1 protein [Emticicia sp. 21SJ11W-3]UTA67029.1 glycosyltransferase family 4 protein [Emticicia sp. 21SJ11W-3]